MASIADQEQSNPASEAVSMPKFGGKQRSKNKWRRLSKHLSTTSDSPINTLDDGCLMHIFSFLSPLPDRYNTALVCHRWRFLACHPRLWLRVDRTIKDYSEPGVFSCIDAAVSAAKPGDTILIAAGGVHFTSNIQIKKPLCLRPEPLPFPNVLIILICALCATWYDCVSLPLYSHMHMHREFGVGVSVDV
uniref:F-box domain-containing protein n=1 Tax=Chenopodium quinoa TaxID=63459 RepID=A0A803MYC3_CHEQI